MSDWWLYPLIAVLGAINWRWGYSVGRRHGREWGARR